MTWVAAGVASAAITAKVVTGIKQKRDAKKKLKEIGESPTEAIPNEVLQNQKMAQLRANTGLPSEQYNQAMKNLQRNQMMALSQGRDRGAGLSLVSKSQQLMDDGTLKLDVANANAKMQNERNLYGVNNAVAGWKDKVWQNNSKNPWDRKYQYAMSLLGAGNQNLASAFDQGAAAGGSFANSMSGGGGGGGNSGGGSNWGLTGYSSQYDRQQPISYRTGG